MEYQSLTEQLCAEKYNLSEIPISDVLGKLESLTKKLWGRTNHPTKEDFFVNGVSVFHLWGRLSQGWELQKLFLSDHSQKLWLDGAKEIQEEIQKRAPKEIGNWLPGAAWTYEVSPGAENCSRNWFGNRVRALKDEFLKMFHLYLPEEADVAEFVRENYFENRNKSSQEQGTRYTMAEVNRWREEQERSLSYVRDAGGNILEGYTTDWEGRPVKI